jgi:hypothetical protein
MSPLSRPLRTVRASCETHGSSKPLSHEFAGADCEHAHGAPSPMGCLASPFAECITRIQLVPRLTILPPSCGRLTRSTSAPFRVGDSPIQPVMPFRCLSAAGLRFLDRPVPTETSRHPYRGRTDLGQISVGFPRSAPSSCDWGGCLLYSGGVVSSQATCGNRLPLKHVLSCFCPSIAVLVNHRVRQLQITEPQRRFTRVHPSSLSLAWVVLMTNAALGL